jgi:hypothetical protein
VSSLATAESPVLSAPVSTLIACDGPLEFIGDLLAGVSRQTLKRRTAHTYAEKQTNVRKIKFVMKRPNDDSS